MEYFAKIVSMFYRQLKIKLKLLFGAKITFQGVDTRKVTTFHASTLITFRGKLH